MRHLNSPFRGFGALTLLPMEGPLDLFGCGGDPSFLSLDASELSAVGSVENNFRNPFKFMSLTKQLIKEM